MKEIDEFCKTFPKNFLAGAVFNELGSELVEVLEAAGCQLIIHDDLHSFEFTRLTPELRAKVIAAEQKRLRLLMCLRG